MNRKDNCQLAEDRYHFVPLVISTEHLAWSATQFATLPKTSFLNPVLPWEPITIRSTLLLSAKETIPSEGDGLWIIFVENDTFLVVAWPSSFLSMVEATSSFSSWIFASLSRDTPEESGILEWITVITVSLDLNLAAISNASSKAFWEYVEPSYGTSIFSNVRSQGFFRFIPYRWFSN